MRSVSTMFCVLVPAILLLALSGCGQQVPDLVGLSLDEATATASEAELPLAEIVYDDESDEDTWTVIAQTPAAGERLSADETLEFTVAGPPPTAVPDIVGLTSEEASAALGEASLLMSPMTEAFNETVTAGVVISQDVSADTTVPQTTPVSVTVSKGPAPRAVPDVVGKMKDDAVAALEAEGFTVSVESTYDDADKDAVIVQSPEGGEEAAYGSDVTIKVSKGVEMVIVPDLVDAMNDATAGWRVEDGRSWAQLVENEVASRTSAVGLRYRIDYALDKPRFTSWQEPRAGTRVPKGTTVTLYVAQGG